MELLRKHRERRSKVRIFVASAIDDETWDTFAIVKAVLCETTVVARLLFGFVKINRLLAFFFSFFFFGNIAGSFFFFFFQFFYIHMRPVYINKLSQYFHNYRNFNSF